MSYLFPFWSPKCQLPKQDDFCEQGLTITDLFASFPIVSSSVPGPVISDYYLTVLARCTDDTLYFELESNLQHRHRTSSLIKQMVIQN